MSHKYRKRVSAWTNTKQIILKSIRKTSRGTKQREKLFSCNICDIIHLYIGDPSDVDRLMIFCLSSVLFEGTKLYADNHNFVALTHIRFSIDKSLGHLAEHQTRKN